VLTKELRGCEITVNAVSPGPTATRLFLDGKPPEVIARLSKAVSLERLGQPNDIASAVAFLAGPDGRPSQGRQGPVTDRLSVKRPSLCSAEGPSLRPDLRTPGVAASGGQGWRNRIRIQKRNVLYIANIYYYRAAMRHHY
jgi:hypothetical protein